MGRLLLSIQDYPGVPYAYRALAACYAHMGRFDEARAIVARLRAITALVVPSDLPFLDLQRQAVHAAPHVGVADRQPHPNPRGYRDHRPDIALTTAAANPVGIEAGMRKRALPANSISIAGTAGHPASSLTGAIRTS